MFVNKTILTLSQLAAARNYKDNKNNKAADMSGLTAEHIKFGGDVLAYRLTSVVNDILSPGKIPDVFLKKRCYNSSV